MKFQCPGVVRDIQRAKITLLPSIAGPELGTRETTITVILGGAKDSNSGYHACRLGSVAPLLMNGAGSMD